MRKGASSDTTSEPILVPASIFLDRRLSFSECIVNHLWIEYRLGPSRIGALLSMDRRNAYTLMQRLSAKIRPARQKPRPEDILVPVSILSSRNAPVQETVVAYLREKGMRNKDIARLLNRSEKTTSTAYHRRGERE